MTNPDHFERAPAYEHPSARRRIADALDSGYMLSYLNPENPGEVAGLMADTVIDVLRTLADDRNPEGPVPDCPNEDGVPTCGPAADCAHASSTANRPDFARAASTDR